MVVEQMDFQKPVKELDCRGLCFTCISLCTPSYGHTSHMRSHLVEKSHGSVCKFRKITLAIGGEIHVVVKFGGRPFAVAQARGEEVLDLPKIGTV